MNSGSKSAQLGFTVVELLVVMAILLTLAGIVYANLGPVRERARETRCLNNFKQIGLAVHMYRDDYGGEDAPGATTHAALGMPVVTPEIALKSYTRSDEIWHCQSEYWADNPPDYSRVFDYMWPPGAIKKLDGSDSQARLTFTEQVERRGLDTPILIDPHHGSYFRQVTPPPSAHAVLVLRLGGQVQRKMVSSPNSWEW
jgi:prepilin-type N-terminal cleavage/methylation domain-containing protein